MLKFTTDLSDVAKKKEEKVGLADVPLLSSRIVSTLASTHCITQRI